MYKHSKQPHQQNSSLLSKHLSLRQQQSQGISWIIQTILAEQILLYVFNENSHQTDSNILCLIPMVHFGLQCNLFLQSQNIAFWYNSIGVNDELYQYFAKLFQKFYLSTNLN